LKDEEEILMTANEYFKVQDNEAIVLWQLAGYDDMSKTRLAMTAQRPLVVMMALDARVIYQRQRQYRCQ